MHRSNDVMNGCSWYSSRDKWQTKPVWGTITIEMGNVVASLAGARQQRKEHS